MIPGSFPPGSPFASPGSAGSGDANPTLTGVFGTGAVGVVTSGIGNVFGTAVVGTIVAAIPGVIATGVVGTITAWIASAQGVFATATVGTLFIIAGPIPSKRWTLQNTIVRTFILKSH